MSVKEVKNVETDHLISIRILSEIYFIEKEKYFQEKQEFFNEVHFIDERAYSIMFIKENDHVSFH